MPDFGPAFGLSAEENQQRWDRMMEKHITTALETVREALGRCDHDVTCWPGSCIDNKDALAALSTIEAELTNAEARCATLTASLAQSVENMNREMAARDRAEAERDEAVAALREIEAQAKVAFRGKVSALTLLDIISRARLSTPKLDITWDASGLAFVHHPAVATPKEPTINEKATRARNLMLEGREDEAKDVWS